jgi:thiamine-phosphate pyrophosphorylase
MKDIKLGLYIITGAYPELGRSHLDVARAALEGGADVIQLRAKDLGGREMLELSLRIREMVDRSGRDCLFIVNDRMDVALAAGADGVHLGQDDIPAAEARTLIGGDMVLGISAVTHEMAVKAQDEGADYLGVGPAFPTPTKPDAGIVIGIEGVRNTMQAVDVPVVAIGGINHSNAEQVLEAGVDGIAVISAVATAENMLDAVLRLRRCVDTCLTRR